MTEENGKRWMDLSGDLVCGSVAALLVCLVVLYRISGTVQFYVKASVYVLIIFLSAIPVILLSLLNPGDTTNHRFWRYVCNWALDHIYKVKVVVRNRDRITTGQPFVMVINHQSAFDVFVLCKYWPVRSACLAKRELKFIWPLGPALQLCGTVFLDRGNRQKAIDTMKHAVDTLIKDRIRLVVFPEGTRNSTGELLPFKKGAFHLAIQAQVPVAPVVMSSFKPFYSAEECRFIPGTVTVECLPLVPTEGLTSDDAGQLSEDIRGQMSSVFSKIKSDAEN